MAYKVQNETPAPHVIFCEVCKTITHRCERDIDCPIYCSDSRAERPYLLCSDMNCQIQARLQKLTDELERTKKDRDEYLKALSVARLSFLAPEQMDRSVESGKMDLTLACRPCTGERLSELSKCNIITLEIYAEFYRARMNDHLLALRMGTDREQIKKDLKAKREKENKASLAGIADSDAAKKAKHDRKVQSAISAQDSAESKTALGKFMAGYLKLGMPRDKVLAMAQQAGFDITGK